MPLFEVVTGVVDELPASIQDILLLVALSAPSVVAILWVSWRHRVWPLVCAMLRRRPGIAACCVALVALSVGLGIAVLTEERALRQASARAANAFDLIVAAPGSDVAALLASVYLQPANLPLLSPGIYARLAKRPDVELVAPVILGDSVDGFPLVGTTAALVQLLASGVVEGRNLSGMDEAVVGATTALAIGSVVSPAHGQGPAAEEGAHAGIALRVVGRLPPTGTPWDRAVIVPLESIWVAHGLGDGHALGQQGRIGPPYDAARMPGVQVIVVRAGTLMANYALRAAFTAERSMAFFPGEVLARLHGLLGNVGRVLSLMATLTTALVVASIVTLQVVLLGGFARRFAMLRAIGAPRRFVFAVAWCYGAALVCAGALFGIGVGQGVAGLLADVLSQASAVTVRPVVGISDLWQVALFVLIGLGLSCIPAGYLASRSIVSELRG